MTLTTPSVRFREHMLCTFPLRSDLVILHTANKRVGEGNAGWSNETSAILGCKACFHSQKKGVKVKLSEVSFIHMVHFFEHIPAPLMHNARYISSNVDLLGLLAHHF